MKKLQTYVALLAVLFISSPLATPLIAQTQDEISEFFGKWKYKVTEGDRVIIATIISVVPTSQRMVVKTHRNDETLVLGLEEEVVMKHGNETVAFESLNRGAAYVLTLSKANMKVNGIYRYE
ncbi:MAG TPA: hypothetical protein VKZ59_03785 [Acidobacteriota bacterium]|nr:hypothetical protein [Acidobacteriota bacterium]